MTREGKRIANQTYEWEKGMRPIKHYSPDQFVKNECLCQRMVKIGCEWLDKHPKADPKFGSYWSDLTNLAPVNKAAHAICKAIEVVYEGKENDGGDVVAALCCILAIKDRSWKYFVKRMSKKK